MNVVVYALYVPSSARSVADLDMEWFDNAGLCEQILRSRTAAGQSRTFYVRDGWGEVEKPISDVKGWPVWDETCYMRVWIRKESDPVPLIQERPDEEWFINDFGLLERLEWEAGREHFDLSHDGGRALHAPGLATNRVRGAAGRSTGGAQTIRPRRTVEREPVASEGPRITYAPAAEGAGEVVFMNGRPIGVLEKWVRGTWRCRAFDDFPDDQNFRPKGATAGDPDEAVELYIEQYAGKGAEG